MTLIKYRTFASSKEFEKWQMDEEPKIIAVSPLVDSANINDLPEGLTLTPKVGIFVTYMVEV